MGYCQDCKKHYSSGYTCDCDTCYFCKGSGHYINECPHLRCDVCGERKDLRYACISCQRNQISKMQDINQRINPPQDNNQQKESESDWEDLVQEQAAPDSPQSDQELDKQKYFSKQQQKQSENQNQQQRQEQGAQNENVEISTMKRNKKQKFLKMDQKTKKQFLQNIKRKRIVKSFKSMEKIYQNKEIKENNQSTHANRVHANKASANKIHANKDMNQRKKLYYIYM